MMTAVQSKIQSCVFINRRRREHHPSIIPPSSLLHPSFCPPSFIHPSVLHPSDRACSSTTMLAPLFPLALLLLCLRVAAPVPTFTDTDPLTGTSVECDRCPPGTHLRASCTATRESECAPCASGSYTALWNYISKCLRCGVCARNQVVKRPCSADRDCECECRAGFYLQKRYDTCFRHSACPSGQEVLTEGTAEEDTVCRDCPPDTFSDTVSAHKNCTLHRSCAGAGQQLVLKGSSWHDAVCTSCHELRSKDGGDYLREIIPAFFVHHKINIKRLRRIVSKLPSEGRKKEGASELNLSDLHLRINAWVASATASQIRQLPRILTKTGVTSTSERLQNKLQRIDSNVNQLCDLRNEVDVIVMSE